MADDARAPSVEEIERSILVAVAADGQVADSSVFAREKGLDHFDVVGAIKSLESDEFVTTGKVEFKYWMLSPEGEEALEHGAPEVRFMQALPAEGVAQADMAAVVGPFAKQGYGQCMKRRWVRMDKATKTVTPVEGAEVVDDVQPLLAKLHAADGSLGVVPDSKDSAEARLLKSRKLAKVATRKSFRVSKGPHFALERQKKVADLTRAMLEDGSWQGQQFKDYNFEALGQEVEGGYLHPLLRVRAEFRSILLEMGFEEMPTNQFVESCFWNFDALFQPQSHPARDAHDTFFIKEPARTLRVPEEYLRSVADIHSNGGHGSTGYNYDWSRDEAMKNILRTHTTAISAKMLHRLGQEYAETGVFTPKKYFSIDRVFRNETTDATHLAEFHQVEFFVADRGMSLGHLIGLLQTFFRRIGITDLRFKPAYNPYTEPSMEVFGFHPDLGKWTEIGNSGLFRPEMLRPMGLPDDVTVIAGGLSLERPTMIKYRISNIRELFGHKVDLDMTRAAPICRF